MPATLLNNLASIRIKNLRLRTFIGIKDEEINNRQDVLINVVIHYDARLALQDNQITSALNYRTITKAIIRQVEDGRFALLERMTQEVLATIMRHDDVLEAEVEIDKPQALRYAESVSVTLRSVRPPLPE